MAARLMGFCLPAWLRLALLTFLSTMTNGAVDVASLSQRLDATRAEMQGRQLALQSLEEFRAGILSGKRIELPSAHRQHLERGSPLISEVSFDARHKPLSTNVSRHFQHVRTLAKDKEVRFHSFMPLKKSAAGPKAGPAALMVLVDTASKLSVLDLEGTVVLNDFDLGHKAGANVVLVSLSPSQENHYVITADDRNEIRVHNLKVVKEKEKKETEDGGAEVPKKAAKKQLVVSANFTMAFTLPPGTGSEARKVTAVLPIERSGPQTFVTGDSLGGISVFQKNGTLKGRVRVTEDSGGIRNLIRSQGQTILFWSSHSFGFFSSSQVDVQYPPCSGWNSPLYDVVMDPGSSSSARVILALEDGDVLVFSTKKGKSQVCDLTLKFPHVSAMPFKLYALRGHIMGLPTPLTSADREEDRIREFYFFNLAAMESGYGTSPSRGVAMQASFRPKQPEAYAVFSGTASAASSSGSGGTSAKSSLGMTFAGEKGIELYDLNLKQPPAPKAASGESGGDGGGGGGWAGNLLDWFPKIGVFGIALIGVVIWNVRKVTNQRKHSSSLDDLDDESFKEKLREARERRKAREAEPESAQSRGSEDVKDSGDEDQG